MMAAMINATSDTARNPHQSSSDTNHNSHYVAHGTHANLSVGRVPELGWRPWLVGKSVAGYVTDYPIAASAHAPASHNFTFLTVREAGHMVPQYQPARALELFRRWLQNEPY
jgi:hypothetical protein